MWLTLCRLFPINTKYTEQKPNCVIVRKMFTTYLDRRRVWHITSGETDTEY